MFTSNFFSHNIAKNSLFFGLILISFSYIQRNSAAKLPDYIVRCKENDPHLNQCLTKAIESIRPKLEKGIPELGIPALEPLILPEVVIYDGENGGVKAKASNITVTGMKNFKLKSLSANLNTLEFKASVFLPSVHFEGTYDVNSQFSGFKLKGKGPFAGNATEITFDDFIKGKFVTIRGLRYLEVESAQVRTSFKSYHIRMEKLFKDKQLNEAFNEVINDRKLVPMETALPMFNDLIARKLVDSWNKVLKKIPFDELFPRNRP